MLAALSVFAAFTYPSGSAQAVQGFAHVGYIHSNCVSFSELPSSWAGAIALIAPGFPRLKEWAYAGFTLAWISAFVAHYLAKDGPKAFIPLILLVLLLCPTWPCRRVGNGGPKPWWRN